MKNKMGKLIFTIAALAMTGVILWYLYSHYLTSPFKEGNLLNAAETTEAVDDVEEKITGTQTETQNQETKRKVSRNGFGVLPYEGNTVNVGEWFTLEKEGLNWIFEFRVNEVQLTKEAIDTDAVYYLQDYPIVELDEEYTILNEYTYLTANVTVKNAGEKEDAIYMNSILYVPYDEETGDIERPFNAGYIFGYKTRADLPDFDKSYAAVTLKPGEEFTCNLVYVVEEKDVNGKIPYLKYSFGMVTDEDDTPYVRIEL